MPKESSSPANGKRRHEPVYAQKAMPRTAHLTGPGVLRVRNNMPCWEPLDGPALLLQPERLETLVVHGSADMTAAALRLLWRHGVQVSFIDHQGRRLLGRVSPPANNAPSLACWQHWAAADPRFCLAYARGIVETKIQSIRQSIDSLASHGHAALRQFGRELAEDCRRVVAAESLASLRGHEGAASARWHAAMRQLFPPAMPYPGRQQHPPPDPVNGLLSLGYTLLLTRVQTHLSAIGLDPLVGVYHQVRAGRPALACDLMEPFRAPVVDQMVVAEVRQGRFRPQHFENTPDGVRLRPADFRRFLTAFEQRFASVPAKEPFEMQARRSVEQFATAVRGWAHDRSLADDEPR